MTKPAATGFACEPLPDGTVQVEFCGDTGETINAVVLSADALRHLPLVVRLTLAVMDQGAARPAQIKTAVSLVGFN